MELVAAPESCTCCVSHLTGSRLLPSIAPSSILTVNYPAGFLETWNSVSTWLSPTKNCDSGQRSAEEFWFYMTVITIHYVLFLFQDSKEYGHISRNDLKEEILMLMARDQHPPEVGLYPDSSYVTVIRCVLTSMFSNIVDLVRVSSLVSSGRHYREFCYLNPDLNSTSKHTQPLAESHF